MYKTIIKWLRAFYTTVLYLLTTVSSLALVAACVMSCFGTSSRICELSCHMMMIYFVMAIFVLAIIVMDTLLLRRRLYIAKLNAICLLLVFGYSSYKVIPLWWRDDKAPTSVQMTLLHLNLAGDRNKNFKTFFTQVKNEKPDLVLVSESSPVWSAHLQRNLKEDYPYFDKSFKSELAIYSKYPISMSQLREIEFIHRKRLITKVMHPMLGPVIVMLVHPVIPIYDVSLAARNEELELYPQDLKEYDSPHILVGDLNCTRWSPYFERLLKAGKLINSETGFGYKPTWPDVMIKPLITIDHVLISRELAVQERRNLGNAGSDHLPVLVKLGLSRTATASAAPALNLAQSR